jgi:hypothetical protein
MTAEEGKSQSPQRTLEPVINPMYNRSTTSNALFSHASKTCYNTFIGQFFTTPTPLLLSCCFCLQKELPYTESLGFFGEYSGSLSSGLLLTTSRDRPRRTGGKVRINKRNFMLTMTKVKRRRFPPTFQRPGLGFPQGDRREMWGSLTFSDSGLTMLYD